MFLLVGCLVLLVFFLYAGVPMVFCKVVRLLLVRKAIKSRTLILTFDDGPGNRLTPAILDILAQNKVKATFFLLGRNIRGRELLVRRIGAEGHEIGSHGYDHIHALKVFPWQCIADIKRGWQAIDDALGSKGDTYLFRPPNGKLNLVSLLYLWAKRVPIIYWTVDSADTWLPEKRDPHRCAEAVKTAGGGITLAHDFDRSTDKTDYYVLESLRLVLAESKKSGMQICTISQLRNRKK